MTLERLGYPAAATTRLSLVEIYGRLQAANRAVGNRATDLESFAYGYWHGVQDERRRTLRENRALRPYSMSAV